MKEATVHIRMKDNPVLLDKILQDIQTTLMDKLAWLDYAFGRAYKIIEHRPDGGKFVYPAIYNGNSEYISLLPNDNFGNFSWFDIYDPQIIEQNIRQFTYKGALVFWYDLSSIYDDANTLHTEEIKNEVINVLTAKGFITTVGRLTISRIYENFENIYKGYALEKIYNNYQYSGENIQEIDKQFFMYPYAGLRIEFELVTRELC